MSPVPFYVLDMAIRKVKGTCVVCIILLDSAVLEDSSFLFFEIKVTYCINKEPEAWVG